MGGLGSGRTRLRDSRAVEDHLSLDVNGMNRAGGFVEETEGSVTLTLGDLTAPLGFRFRDDRLHLSYWTASSAGCPEWTGEVIPLARLPWRWRSHRLYFVCPGVTSGARCARRVGRLYLVGGRFRCRHCHGLAYASQREDAALRAARKAAKLAARISGGPSNTRECVPGMTKPKYRHWATHARLTARAAEATVAAFEADMEWRERQHALWEEHYRRRPHVLVDDDLMRGLGGSRDKQAKRRR